MISTDIHLAAQFLKNEGVVGIPTETVYGLAANALSECAIRKIFDIKERPITNPLIIHIKDYEENNLAIFSRKVLKMICSDETGWEEMLPNGTADVIKKEKLFSYACEIDLKASETNT